MKENKMTQTESLAIITQMINNAKQEQKDNGTGWILWGCLLFAASILSFFNDGYHWFSTYFFWNLFGIASLLLLLYSVLNNFVFKKNFRVKTYTTSLFDKLNIGFFISLMLIIVSINKGVPPVYGFALMLNLYGFWILIYASALNFKPSVVGAYFTWACALCILLFVTTFKYTMLIHAFAILGGYVIPGHLARIEFNKTSKVNL
jgi:MFS family permease